MKILLRLVSIAGLLLTLVSALLASAGILALETHYTWLLIGMVLWFASAPLWMKEQSDEPGKEGAQ